MKAGVLVFRETSHASCGGPAPEPEVMHDVPGSADPHAKLVFLKSSF
jgi:hypothetical protein